MPSTHPFRAELRALVRLALPLSVAAAGQALMGVVDTAVVGRSSAAAMGGTGLGNALFFALGVFGMGLMHGVDPLVSQALGAGDPARARRFLWQGIWLAIATSAVLSIPLAVVPSLLVRFGIPPDVGREAARYLWARLPGLPLFLLYFVARAYLQAHGTTRPMVIAVVTANLLNVPAVALLVFGGAALPAWAGPPRAVPAMGAGGAGLATTLCMVVQSAILAAAIGQVPFPRVGGHRRLVWRDLRAAVGVGGPIALHMGTEVGIFALVAFLAGRLGTGAMAAHQVAISIASLTFTFAVGFGEAGSVRVGWAVGARDRGRARRAGLAAFSAGAGFMSASALLFVLFPGTLARLMTSDPQVVATAVPLLRVAALFQISDGIQGVGAGVLRGAGETRFTFAANVVGHWAIGLPATVLLGFTLGHGVTGLWGGFCFGLTTVAVALLVRFLRVSSREIVPLADRAVA
jgi:multidrug resistance protein, MATE family